LAPNLAVRETGDAFWRKMRSKSLLGATYYLNKAWAPLHNIAVEQVTREQIKARRDEIAEKNPVSANRALAALSVFYGWAIDKGHHKGTNPTADIKPLPENKRSRVLRLEDELPVILQAADAIGGDFGAIAWLLALTGCRRAEITVLRNFTSRAPNMRPAHLNLAITYAQLGQVEEARAEAAEVLRLQPD
jgi:integrase